MANKLPVDLFFLFAGQIVALAKCFNNTTIGNCYEKCLLFYFYTFDTK